VGCKLQKKEDELFEAYVLDLEDRKGPIEKEVSREARIALENQGIKTTTTTIPPIAAPSPPPKEPVIAHVIEKPAKRDVLSGSKPTMECLTNYAQELYPGNKWFMEQLQNGGVHDWIDDKNKSSYCFGSEARPKALQRRVLLKNQVGQGNPLFEFVKKVDADIEVCGFYLRKPRAVSMIRDWLNWGKAQRPYDTIKVEFAPVLVSTILLQTPEGSDLEAGELSAHARSLRVLPSLAVPTNEIEALQYGSVFVAKAMMRMRLNGGLLLDRTSSATEWFSSDCDDTYRGFTMSESGKYMLSESELEIPSCHVHNQRSLMPAALLRWLILIIKVIALILGACLGGSSLAMPLGLLIVQTQIPSFAAWLSALDVTYLKPIQPVLEGFLYSCVIGCMIMLGSFILLPLMIGLLAWHVLKGVRRSFGRLMRGSSVSAQDLEPVST
jgi:hypothetical protein